MPAGEEEIFKSILEGPAVVPAEVLLPARTATALGNALGAATCTGFHRGCRQRVSSATQPESQATGLGRLMLAVPAKNRTVEPASHGLSVETKTRFVWRGGGVPITCRHSAGRFANVTSNPT